jgi:hypothetical protein
MNKAEKVLYIDSKDLHLDEENSFSVHPFKFSWLSNIQKETFDRAVIQNTPTHLIKSLSLFFLAQTVKINGIVDIFVDQPISVMQSLDASEIEANARLAGFSDPQQFSHERWVKDGERDVKISTIKVSLIRPEKVSLSSEIKK